MKRVRLESDITMVLEWGETEFHVKKPDGIGGKPEDPR